MPTHSSQATAEGMPADRAQRIKNTAEQLVKQVRAGNVNTEYDFSDHNAIWQCMRLRSGEKLTKEEAVEAYLNAASTAPQIEQYWALQRVNALSKEIAAELNKIEGYHLVIIRP
ncbi:hypothetical protein D6J61_27520, partial [Salmonella enterica subsp. enterica serovar Alachua]|nr:hypothetical protein [Salmonella enterica subsp. enterica serovar Alachua]